MRKIYFGFFVLVALQGFSQFLYQSVNLAEWDSFIPRYTALSTPPTYSITRASNDKGRIYIMNTPNTIQDTNQYVWLEKNFSKFNLHRFDSIEVQLNWTSPTAYTSAMPFYPRLSIEAFTYKGTWIKIGEKYTYKKMPDEELITVKSPPFTKLRFIFRTWSSNSPALGISDVKIKGIKPVFSMKNMIFDNEDVSLYEIDKKLFFVQKNKTHIEIKLYDFTGRQLAINTDINNLQAAAGLYYFVADNGNRRLYRDKFSIYN